MQYFQNFGETALSVRWAQLFFCNNKVYFAKKSMEASCFIFCCMFSQNSSFTTLKFILLYTTDSRVNNFPSTTQIIYNLQAPLLRYITYKIYPLHAAFTATTTYISYHWKVSRLYSFHRWETWKTQKVNMILTEMGTLGTSNLHLMAKKKVSNNIHSF